MYMNIFFAVYLRNWIAHLYALFFMHMCIFVRMSYCMLCHFFVGGIAVAGPSKTDLFRSCFPPSILDHNLTKTSFDFCCSLSHLTQISDGDLG